MVVDSNNVKGFAPCVQPPRMNRKTRLAFALALFPISIGSAWSQVIQVTNVVNYGELDNSFAPSSVVIIYGAFPQGAGKDFSITVGGQTGAVSIADNTVFITAEIPTTAPLGAQTLTVNYMGASSNAYPITISPYAPEFEENSVEILSSTSQPVFEPLPPFTHSVSGLPVTANSPAQPGETLITYLSGLGQTNPPTTGGPPATFTPLAATPSLTVGNLPATISRSGSLPTAGAEVDFTVPSNTPNGTSPVILTIGGINSNTASLSVGNQPAAFFTGQQNLGSGVYYLQFPNANLFGFYTYTSSTSFYHYDMGFEAFIPSNDAQSGIYLYDFTSSHWFYTTPSVFPSLYDYTLTAWIYYFPSTTNSGHYTSNPRYFVNLATKTIFTM
jgi:uncharacterized protein (TIGR03437 family)